MFTFAIGASVSYKFKIKAGDKIIALKSGRVFLVKYFVGGAPVVSNGVFDFPLKEFVLYSPLMEELI